MTRARPARYTGTRVKVEDRWAWLLAASFVASTAGVGPSTALGADDDFVRRGLAQPGVRLFVLRAEGADFSWRDFPRLDGLKMRTLARCGAQREAPCLDGRWGLEPGRASAWSWRGERILHNAEPEDIRRLFGRYLGPKPKVWVDADSPAARRAAIEAFRASSLWAVTHSIHDARRFASFDARTATPPCDDDEPPPLSVVRIRRDRATWFDPERACTAVTAEGRGPALVAALTQAWKATVPPQAAPPDRAPTDSTGLQRRVDDDVREAIAHSQSLIDSLAGRADPRLLAAARKWIGVRYRRHGSSAAGIDDVHLLRAIYRDVYNHELTGDLIDWMHRYEKVAVDNRDPEAALRPGDLLFKVTYGLQPREAWLCLGSGYVLIAKEVIGVVVTPTPSPSVRYGMAARRPGTMVKSR